MAFIIKGSMQVGEIKTPQPSYNKNIVHQNLNDLKALATVKTEPLQIPESTNYKTEPEPLQIPESTNYNFIRRESPVKITESVDENYRYVEEGELIKHYNKRSSYLNDMADIEEIK